MTRNYTDAQLEHIQGENVRPTYLAALHFDAETLLFTTAPFPLLWDYNGDEVEEEFRGVGDAGGITAFEEAVDGSAQTVTLSLSIANPPAIQLAVAEHIRGRPADIWIAWLDENNDFIDQPALRFTGFMDVMPWKIAEDGKSGQIDLRIISRDVLWERPNNYPRYTNEDHKARFSDDDFFSRLAEINGGREVAWGVDF